MTTHNTNSSEFGRQYFKQEVDNKQIASTNRAINSKGNHKVFVCRAKIEDFKTAKELGITIEDLNKNRMVQNES